MSRVAIESFSRETFAEHYAVNAALEYLIAPGPVDTPIHATYSNDLQATYADLARRIPLGRMGRVDDVAAWVWFLVAPDSTWTTGNVIHVDGGQVLGLPAAAGG